MYSKKSRNIKDTLLQSDRKIEQEINECFQEIGSTQTDRSRNSEKYQQ